MITRAIPVNHFIELETWCLGSLTDLTWLELGQVSIQDEVVYDGSVLDFGQDRNHTYLLHLRPVHPIEEGPLISVLLCDSIPSILENKAYCLKKHLNRFRNACHSHYVIPGNGAVLHEYARSLRQQNGPIHDSVAKSIEDVIIQVYKNGGLSYTDAIEHFTREVERIRDSSRIDDYLSTKYFVSHAVSIVASFLQCPTTVVNTEQ